MFEANIDSNNNYHILVFIVYTTPFVVSSLHHVFIIISTLMIRNFSLP